MSKIKTFAIATGLATGLVASAAPVATFAMDTSSETTPTRAKSLDVDVNVATVISLRLESHYLDASGNDTYATTTCDSRDVVTDPSTGEITDDGCTDVEQIVHTTLLPSSQDLTSMYTNAYVTTNSASGYVLTVIDSDENNNLQTAAGATIAPIASGTPTASTNPGWGISTNSGTSWQSVPASSESALTLKSYAPATKVITVNDLTTINYGIATAATQATGTYTDSIVYTATAND